MATPIRYYISNHSLEDWMIYRFVTSAILSILSTLLFCVSNLTNNIVNFTLHPTHNRDKNLLYYLFEGVTALTIGILFIAIGTALISESIWTRLLTGHTAEHWSRYISLVFFYLSGAIFILSYFTNKVLKIVNERFIYLQLNLN